MKKEWIEISCLPEQEIIRPADTQPDTPIGVAIVNEMGEPGWLGNHPDLKIHHGSICACWPGVNVVEEAK